MKKPDFYDFMKNCYYCVTWTMIKKIHMLQNTSHAETRICHFNVAKTQKKKPAIKRAK